MGLRGRERGPACSRGQQRVSVFGSARQAVTRSGFVAAVKIRDAQRVENMSNSKERVDCGCGLRFQEKEVEDTSTADLYVFFTFYGCVSL